MRNSMLSHKKVSENEIVFIDEDSLTEDELRNLDKEEPDYGKTEE